ncbi:hypothetical protein B484DRAFT_411136 [Ochromonadaceae sp. CCMP2298]|nr:hypothetical protein B484DRAFT_411136 [Ochromonadaceae sp. CCMP2298]
MPVGTVVVVLLPDGARRLCCLMEAHTQEAGAAAEAEAAAALAPLRAFDGQEEWLMPRSACEASVLLGVGVWMWRC